MRVVAMAEGYAGEPRVAIAPESVSKWLSIGRRRDGQGPSHTVGIEAGAGAGSGFSDDDYRRAGAEVVGDRSALLGGADVVVRVSEPDAGAVGQMRPGSVYAGFLGVYSNGAGLGALAERGVSGLALELMPRTTRAQTMDAISSQHSLAGYAMVVLAAQRLGRVMPMMVTPSGTLQAARVLVIGAGVAGLQAIATARRLGARVEAFDTRPATREQVESLGARFIEIDLGGTGEGAGGYARELTAEQQAAQRAALAKSVARADVVITTAAVPGRRAPVIVTGEMLGEMSAGSVVVDYAAATGGNVEGTRAGEEVVTAGGVKLIGLRNYAGLLAADASRMMSANFVALVRHICGAEGQGPQIGALLGAGDEIVAGCLAVHGGRAVHAAAAATLGVGLVR